MPQILALSRIFTRLVRLLYVWRAPSLVFFLSLLSGIPFIALTLFSPILILIEPVEHAFSLVADARALGAGTLRFSDADNLFILGFIWIADHVPALPGRVLLIARAIMALFALCCFALFAARRLPLWPAMVLGAAISLFMLNPYLSLENTLLCYVLIMMFGYLIPPVASPDTRKNNVFILTETIIGAVLFAGLALSTIYYLLTALVILTLSAFLGGGGRGVRYFGGIALIFASSFLGYQLWPDLFTVFHTNHYADVNNIIEIINIPTIWFGFLMILTILVFSARSILYPLLYNRISMTSSLYGASAAIICIASLGVTGQMTFENIRYQYLGDFADQLMIQKSQPEVATMNRFLIENYAMIHHDIPLESDILSIGQWVEAQKIIAALQPAQETLSKKIAIISDADIACIVTPFQKTQSHQENRRDCFSNGLLAAKFSDIVLVPKVPSNLFTDRLVRKSEGILYSEFKHSEESDFWHIWKRRQ